MSLPTNRQDGDVIENEDINAIAAEVNRVADDVGQRAYAGHGHSIDDVQELEARLLALESDSGTSEPQSVAASLDPTDPKKLTLLLTIPSQPSVALTLTKEGYKVTASWVGSSPDGLSLTYTIDWGDGPTSATSPATHTYPSVPATRTVTVAVTDSEGGTASDSQSIQLAPPDVSAYGAAVLADNPVVYYPLGDSSLPVVDYMGTTTATTTGVLQNVNLGDTARSLKIENQNPGVNIGQPPALDDLTQFTFECLIRTNIPDEQGRMVYRGHTEGALIQGIEIVWNKATGIMFKRRMQGDPSVSSITLDYTTNDRLHVVGTYDAATGLRLYVNGVLQGQKTGAYGPLPGAGTSDWGFANQTWSNIAGVAFYDKVLDAARVQAHATAAGL